MGFPICDSCALSAKLCDNCAQKVRSGEVSELEVLLSTLLIRKTVTGYKRIDDLENKIIIYAEEEEIPKIIGPGGKNVSDLSKKLGRRIVVLSDSWATDKKIEYVVKPVKLIKRNKVYKEDGSEVTKLIFDKPLDEATKGIVQQMQKGVEIDYETESYVRGTKRKKYRR